MNRKEAFPRALYLKDRILPAGFLRGVYRSIPPVGFLRGVYRSTPPAGSLKGVYRS